MTRGRTSAWRAAVVGALLLSIGVPLAAPGGPASAQTDDDAAAQAAREIAAARDRANQAAADYFAAQSELETLGDQAAAAGRRERSTATRGRCAAVEGRADRRQPLRGQRQLRASRCSPATGAQRAAADRRARQRRDRVVGRGHGRLRPGPLRARGQPAAGGRQPGRHRGQAAAVPGPPGRRRGPGRAAAGGRGQAAGGRARPRGAAGPAARGAAPARDRRAAAARGGGRRGRRRRGGRPSRRPQVAAASPAPAAIEAPAPAQQDRGAALVGVGSSSNGQQLPAAPAPGGGRSRAARPTAPPAAAAAAQRHRLPGRRARRPTATRGARRAPAGARHQGVDMLTSPRHPARRRRVRLGAVQADQPRRQLGVGRRQRRQPLLLRPPRQLRGLQPVASRRAR